MPDAKPYVYDGWSNYYCHACSRLYNLFEFSITHENGKYIPDYNCATCQSSLIKVEVQARSDHVNVLDGNLQIEYKCPKCKSSMAEDEQAFLLWD